MRGKAYYIEFMLFILFLTCPVQAQYSGGTGEPKDPYQITTAEDLILLGDSPDDYDNHFILTADIDLDPNLPDGKVFSKAVIAPAPLCVKVFANAVIASDQPVGQTSMNTPFTGVFDGNGYTISNLTITGGSYLGLFGYLGFGASIYNLGLEAVHVNGAGDSVGGLAGCNYGGGIIMSYSTGMVTGIGSVGGLVGYNWQANITMSYSTSKVNGVRKVGGLVGCNRGSITTSYSIGTVTGDENVGGLVGINYGFINMSYCTGIVSREVPIGEGYSVGGLVGHNDYSIISSFWDMETSGQTISSGGTGLTTAEMQSGSTFLEAGWDFTDEAENGTEDVWWILEGQHYPRLCWQYGRAFSPYPQNGAVDVPQPLALKWFPGGSGLQHDVYFGEDKEAVANATIESPVIYRGRQEPEITTYDPGNLELEKNYYWRIDEVNQADPNNPWKGNVWSFKTSNFIVLDDFESYDAGDNKIWYSWHDGLGYGDPGNPPYFAGNGIGYADPGIAPYFAGNGTGSCVGEIDWMEETIVHSGCQSMTYYYNNNRPGCFKYSEATLTLDYPRDWTDESVEVLSLWFRGNHDNDSEPMYVAVANAAGPTAVVNYDNPNAAQVETWTEWKIDLKLFADQGVVLTDVDMLSIGFGDRNNPQPGGSGKMWFDDIRLYRPRPAASHDLEVNVP